LTIIWRRNPVTHGDWEGKGVEPDVKVGAADALATAEKLAADKLAALERPATGH
jgi:C-terminal processing protease CtpA/Prc